MVRIFDIGGLISAELAKEATHQVHLFKITAASTYYWTDCDQSISFDSQWWERKNIRFDAAQLSIDSKVDTISLEMENIDKSFSDWVLGENIQGKEIRIYRVWLDTNLHVIGAITEADLKDSILFVGFLDQITIDRRRARIQVYNHFIQWKKTIPRRIHSPNCQWLFKGAECLSASTDVSCDKTWAACTAYSNTLNFGGFRHLPDLATKDIMWGTIAKNWHK
jgi:hypothetical protein